ncbi:phage holin family protein [Kribbia dieselivorans]|uniref:phage holin family protein n=1 Tax=Kribbia dieselivorans TaxID=331526 RepID=UPI00083876BF|nr:phage holin family protein [Kribbia dieselivorans]
MSHSPSDATAPAAEPFNPERTIGQLVADATHDISTIVRGEIALAKAEVTSGAKIAGTGVGLLVGAAFVGLLGLVLFFHFMAWLIAVWLPVWAGYLIVAGLLFVIAAVLGLLGVKSLKKAKPVPTKAIKEAQDTIAVLKSAG